MVLHRYSIPKLAKISVYIAVGGFSAVLLMRSTLRDRIRAQEYYKEALRITRAHDGAKHLLGEPIKDLGFDISDRYNYCNDKKVQLNVCLKGPKERGHLYFWAEKPEDTWTVTRIELAPNNEKDRRLLVKKADE
jgi:cytochrome c oxidase assembly factor 1